MMSIKIVRIFTIIVTSGVSLLIKTSLTLFPHMLIIRKNGVSHKLKKGEDMFEPVEYIIGCLVIILTIRLIVEWKSNSKLKSYYKSLSLNVNSSLTKEKIKAKIQELYLHNKIKNIRYKDDYICFSDRFDFLSEGNTYYIKYSNPTELYFRGKMYFFATSYNKFESMRFFLSNVK